MIVTFNDFWFIYPRKTHKAEARKAWNKLKPSFAVKRDIEDNLNARAKAGEWQDKQFIPHAATYLNNERWEDEVTARTIPNGQRKESNAERSTRQTTEILANIEAREAHSSSVGANEPTLRPQVGHAGRPPHDGERRLFEGISSVVPEDGAFDG